METKRDRNMAAKPNGYNSTKKKASAIIEDTNNNNNNNNNNSDHYYKMKKINEETETDGFDLDYKPTGEDIFAETKTVAAHAKLDDEELIVRAELQSSVGQVARDQFAVALLRLQTQLDTAGKRLSDVENKLDTLTSLRQQRTESKSSRPKSALFNKSNLTTILYLGWPVLVFALMRTIERRALLSAVKSPSS